MTVVTTRPDATIGSQGSLVGAGSVHAALSDNSDSSHFIMDGNGDYVAVEYADPSIGGTYRVVSVRLRARTQSNYITLPSTKPVIDFHLGQPGQQVQINWSSATIHTVLTYDYDTLPANFSSVILWISGVLEQFYLFELYFDTIYVAQPTLDVTAPTGTVTNNNIPEVIWNGALDTDGGPQTKYEVKIFDDATYGGGGFNPDTSTPDSASGILNGSAERWQSSVRLDDDTYRAYVRVAQSVNGTDFWSPWTYEQFIIDVPNPATPTISVTADSANGRIGLNGTAGGGGEVTTDFLEYERSLDSGATWEKVRTSDGLSGIALVAEDPYDYEAPNGATAVYRCRAIHDFGGGFTSVSPWSATDSDSWTSTGYWLKHPTTPSLNKIILLGSPAESGVTRAQRQGSFQPFGVEQAVAIAETRMSSTGSLQIRSDDQTAKDNLDALLADSAPLLLQTLPNDYEPDRWLSLGNHQRTRITDAANFPKVWDVIEWTEVARPGGALV